jgi:hypothetical protein
MAYATGGSINRIGGHGGQGIKEESSTQKAPLGEKLELGDGRCFRYAKAAAAIEIAHLVAADTTVGQLGELDATTTVSCTAGDKEFSITGSGSQLSTTAGFYNDAYLIISDGTGAGETHHIKSHTTAASDKITFTLYDPVTTAFVAASGVAITGNLYGNVLTCDGTSRALATDSFARGATTRAIQSGYYFWMQTRGTCSLQFDGAVTAASAVTYGAPMVASIAHDGQVEQMLDAYDAFQTIGNFTGTNTEDDDYVPVFLTIE